MWLSPFVKIIYNGCGMCTDFCQKLVSTNITEILGKFDVIFPYSIYVVNYYLAIFEALYHNKLIILLENSCLVTLYMFCIKVFMPFFL